MPVAVDTEGRPRVPGADVVSRAVAPAAVWPDDAAPRVVVRRPRRRTRSALDVLVVGAIAYGGAAVLNAHHLHRAAARLPLDSSSRRPLLVASGVVDRASGVVGLDRPGRSIDDERGITDPAPTPHGVPAALVSITSQRGSGAAVARGLAIRARSVADAAAVAAADALARATALAAQQPTFTDPRWQRLPAEDRAHPAVRPTATGAGPTGSGVTGSGPTGSVTPPVATTPRPPVVPQLRTPTAADPWRIYVGGDSLAQGIGPALARMGTGSGLMSVTPHGVLSSGLSRPDAFDWPSAIATAAGGNDEIVVLVFGANDPQAMSVGSTSLQFGTPEWTAEYARRVSEVLDTLAGKTVVWVGLPVVGRPDLERQLQVLDGIYRAQAAAHPNVAYVDVRALTSTDGVTYQPYLDAGDGTEFLARTNDKVHFTTQGYDLLAQAVTMRLVQLTQP